MVDPVAVIFSDHGHPLVYMPKVSRPQKRVVLTVENYCKWYALYAVKSDYKFERVEFGDLEQYTFPDQAPYCDHVPNPVSVKVMCQRLDWDLDEQAYEMMIGRWELEYKENEAY
jgi:hypothetical protein